MNREGEKDEGEWVGWYWYVGELRDRQKVGVSLLERELEGSQITNGIPSVE